MTMEQAIAHLAATYEDWIGYDPIAEGRCALEVARTSGRDELIGVSRAS